MDVLTPPKLTIPTVISGTQQDYCKTMSMLNKEDGEAAIEGAANSYYTVTAFPPLLRGIKSIQESNLQSPTFTS
jgi:hypothetical protein